MGFWSFNFETLVCFRDVLNLKQYMIRFILIFPMDKCQCDSCPAIFILLSLCAKAQTLSSTLSSGSFWWGSSLSLVPGVNQGARVHMSG